MIYDVKENIERYKGIHDNLDRALEYYYRGNFSQIGEGTYPIHGCDVLASVQEALCISEWESHRQYANLLFCLSGSEKVGHQTSQSLTDSEAYDINQDVQYYKENNKGLWLDLVPGNFIVLFPGEAHRVVTETDEAVPCKKVSVKIRIS